jgi:acetyl esterase/lipase
LKTIRLWEGDAPGALGTGPADIPTLTFVSDDKPSESKPGFIVCPGGGYGTLAPHEAEPIAEWFESVGVRAAVLRYRLGPVYHNPAEIHDAQRAIRYVRANADKIGIDPKRLGMIGFSAGGHLSATAATHWDRGDSAATDPIDRASCRPDLSMLIYPVIRMSAPYGHAGSRENLLGKEPGEQLIASLDNDRIVSLDTPRTFLFHGADDDVVPIQNSLLYAMALAEHKVPFSLHFPQHGPHGFGLGQPGSDQDWRSLAAAWLKTNGF